MIRARVMIRWGKRENSDRVGSITTIFEKHAYPANIADKSAKTVNYITNALQYHVKSWISTLTLYIIYNTCNIQAMSMTDIKQIYIHLTIVNK